MSTKSTVAYGSNFHFFDDFCMDGSLYLRLDNYDKQEEVPEFKAESDSFNGKTTSAITVRIPQYVLKAMFESLKKCDEQGWPIYNVMEEDPVAIP